MKNFKRIIALILAVVMAVLVPVAVFAADEEETTEAATEATSSSKGLFDKVATLYINVSNANPKMPHTWIYIINESDEPITVGYYTVPVGGCVSIGNFHDRGSGGGIHYNLERYWVKEATYDRTYSMKTNVSRLELKSVTSAIKRLNHYDTVFCNCSFFACTIWDLCSPRILIHMGYPQITLAEMIMWGAKKINYTVDKVYSVGNVYKQVDGGLTPINPSVVYTNYGV